MQSLLKDKSPEAIEGLTITLDAVDAIFATLLEQIEIKAIEVEREIIKARDLDPLAYTGTLIRLNVQKQTIEQLREGIPNVVIEGDAAVLARII